MLATSLNVIQYRYLSFESQLHVSIPKIEGGGAEVASIQLSRYIVRNNC